MKRLKNSCTSLQVTPVSHVGDATGERKIVGSNPASNLGIPYCMIKNNAVKDIP
jgi:hypothetical protein